MLLRLCQLAPIIFLLNSFILGSLQPGYNPRTDTISMLARGQYSHWQTANFIIFGILTLLLFYLTISLESTLRNSHLILVGAVVLGLSLVLLGTFPTDQPGETTLQGQLHGAIFIASVLIQALLQLTLALSNLPTTAAFYLLISGLITAVGPLGMLLLPGSRGLIQRIFVGAIMLWVTTSSFWLKK